MLPIVWFLIIAASLFHGCASNRSTPYTYTSPNPPPNTPLSSNITATEDIMRVGDILNIRLTGVPQEDVAMFEDRVDEEGYISMPLIGRIKAAGKTTAQLKQEIENNYRSRRIYATPNVTITFAQLRFINVIGEVRTPQRVPFTNDLTVLKALAACNGFTDFANRRAIRILRGNQVIPFDAVEAIRNPALDLPLQVGDQIQVPRTIW
ncbi:MAG: polysaccharide export protein [Methylacidiphilales bacterium]|nr:polysaccharide export protein [Candidatus Methylacidiphilales bacterium]MDW8349256.1 polysaccharide biosynthesis/export family protein [Verrucomicrobiae bacterium]